MQRDPAILLLALGQTLAWASVFYLFPALLLRWEQDLGWSKADLTAAITMALLVSAIASPLTGHIIDKGHGALLITGSALAGGSGLILLSCVETLWQFYAVWMFLGLAMSGSLYDPCFALVTRSRGKNAKSAIILITLIAGFASTISYPVLFTLAENLGWRGAVQIAAGVMIVIVAPVFWTGAGKLGNIGARSEAETPSRTTEKTFLNQPAFWLLGIGFACLAISHGAALHHLLPILDERGLSTEAAVLAASFIGPMQVAGRLAMMSSERFISLHGVTIGAFCALALSMVMLIFSATSPAFLAGFVIFFGAAYGTVSILRPLLTRNILGEQNFGAKSGALALPYLAGAAAAPFLASLIWNLGGYDLMLSILLVVLVVGCIAYALAHKAATSGPDRKNN